MKFDLRPRLVSAGIAAACVLFLGFVPFITNAFPFGGAIQTRYMCYNNAIYARLGPPVGGPYVWTPATQTYRFGQPQRVGQWLLGLASAPYYCVVSISPVWVEPGTAISMMGSSGAAAPASPSQPANLGCDNRWTHACYNLASQYDAEEGRLRAEQANCLTTNAANPSVCTFDKQADAVNQERQQRFPGQPAAR